MDPELKSELDRHFEAVVELIHQMGQRMDAQFAEVITRFDTQAARLDRHGSLFQTGNRWIARINDWSEKIDSALEQKDREIADLRKRLDKLEQNGQH